jgi:hypothetical protein
MPNPCAHNEPSQKESCAHKDGQPSAIWAHEWELIVDCRAHHLSQPKLGADTEDEKHGEEEQGPEPG